MRPHLKFGILSTGQFINSNSYAIKVLVKVKIRRIKTVFLASSILKSLAIKSVEHLIVGTRCLTFGVTNITVHSP